MADLPGEEINLDDLDYDEDEFESTVGDTTGAVGGSPAETDFRGGQIRTPADRSSVRRRGSVEWETDRDANIASETRNSIKDLNERLDLLKQHADSPSLKTTIKTLQKQKAELARDAFRDYVLEEYGLAQQGTAFVTEASYAVDDSGRVKVKYRGKIVWLTKQNRMEFYSLDSIASKIKGSNPTASEFIRLGLGIKDYKRGSSVKLQKSATKASTSLRDVPKLRETPTGRPKNARRVIESLQQTNQDIEDLGTDLANVPIAKHEEINTFLTEQGQLKRLSDVYEHLVKRRDEKETELKNLKSKGDRAVSFVNPGYEGEEGEGLLPVSEEDAERARELEAGIREFDIAIAEQDAKVRNSIQRLQRSIENFIESDDTLGSRVRKLFRREGVTIASLLTAIGMTVAAVVEGFVLATRSAVSAVIPAPKPKPPAPKPPGPKPDVPDTPIEPPKPPEPKPLGPKPKTWTDWLKDQIQKIADLLLKLGDKALIALPGIIGAVVNFVLKSGGAVAGFLADHLWAFAAVVVGILYTSVMEISNKYTKKETKKKKVSKNRNVNKK